MMAARGYQAELRALRDAPVSPHRSPVGIGPGKRKAKHAGHVCPPGSGPEGEACGSCRHRARNQLSGKAVSKCGLNRARWTGGVGSDIRVRDPACQRWEAKTS